MSLLSKVLGFDAKKRAEAASDKAVADLTEQKEVLKKETDKINAEKQVTLKKTQAKQIKALRSSFRTPGFSEVQDGNTKEKLG